ncbi:MAG: alpha/beta hydrolase [Bryobacteraceae bacterium]|jgi:pimeloyl-ACP methyl ester carboxylesterase
MRIPSYYPYRSAAARDAYLSFCDSIDKQWPVVSQSRMVSTSFGRTFVRVSGPAEGEPLVLLPGMASTSLFWAPNIEALSKRHRIYAVDIIGEVGRSVCTRRMAGATDFMNWLDELFTALDLGEKIHLVGMSQGGWLATQYALRFAGRVRKLVLLAPAATVLPIRWAFYFRGALVLTGRRYFAKAAVYWLLEDVGRKDAARMEASVDRALLTSRCMQPRRRIALTVLQDHELRSLRVPTLFLVGEHEKIYSAEKAVRRLNSIAPRVRTEIIPDAGHDLTIAQPELVSRKILEFLTCPPDEAPF